MQDVLLVSACRSAIGGFGGITRELPVATLGARVLSAALERGGAEAGEVEEVILGNVLQGMLQVAPARVAALEAGIPEPVPAFTVNKACGSGLKAVALGAQAIRVGDADVVLAGGMESMNTVPYALPRARRGYRMGHAPLVDLLTDGLTCPIEHIHMGITAENVADRHGIGREEQDAWAARSYEKAHQAQRSGRFKAEIVPVPVPQPKGEPVSFDADEDVRDTDLAALAALRPAFRKEGGTVTAGNASNINDGASALLVASERAVSRRGWRPLARVCGAASAGLEPSHMGLGPARAVPRLMQKLDWSYDSVDLWELNEAFAAQTLGVLRELPEVDPERVNVHGGAIALGHPVGASGARILTTLLYALRERGGRRGVASLCIGSGMGIALGVELVD